MRFIVYGAGAIGSTIGGHLFRTGHEVALVANPRHVDRIRESGLRLVTSDRTYDLRIPAYKEARELDFKRNEDLVLLTAKSQHTLLCLGQLRNAGAPRNLPVFCTQNSICNEPMATRIFDRIYGVMVRVPGIFLQAGEVINPISGNAGFLEVGLYPSGSDELAQMVAGALRTAGFAGGVNECVMKAKAAKCLLNLANAFAAITDTRGNGDEFMARAREEAMKVWKAAGIEWEDMENFRARTAVGRIGKMPEGYANQSNLGSSWQSLIRVTGNIEAEYLNGDVVKLGTLLGISTPYNMVLWKVADAMARKKERPGKYSAEELVRLVQDDTAQSQ